MDGGNKRVSMGILVEQAHSLFDAQFFVFTPHEPDELPQDDPFIKYFKWVLFYILIVVFVHKYFRILSGHVAWCILDWSIVEEIPW